MFICSRGISLSSRDIADFSTDINHVINERDLARPRLHPLATATLLKQLEDQYYYIQIIKVDEKFHSPVSPNKIVFIVDLTCAPEAISWGASHNLFANPFKWILLYNEKSSLNILEHFENISLLVDSDVTLAGLGVNDTISLKKIFKHRSYMDIIEENVGVLNSNEQLILEPSFEVNRFRRRQDLKGIVLNSCIVITNNNSLNHLTDKRDKHIDSIAKVNYVLVQHLADFVNARLEYTVESTWGYKNNQSIWSGMIGELTRNKADIGGTALFITEDRVSTIDYIAMTTKTRSKFVFREPKLSYVTNVFVLPFDRDVWLASAALVVITGFVLFLVVKWEWYERKNGNLKEDEPYMELRESITDVAVLTFGALCQQGTTAIPYSMPGRITLIFLLISLMFLYTSYSANIVALLQSSSKSIQTLEDLLKSRLEVGIDDTVFNHFYFPNATEPIRKAIYEKKVAPPGQVPRYFPLLDGVKRMRQGLFAFHMETGPGYKIVGEIFEEGEKCGLQEIQFLQVPDPWLAIQKNSSFKESLKIG
ncbi:hypothetical protein HHI36_008512 [Cryptolaemus montrouzieri]|uniref:Uncharacterized protein n=1 Tax=Cryptolaemus montrouzieri TaxID=559131 RepID=A0ABD2MT88_9CUCU